MSDTDNLRGRVPTGRVPTGITFGRSEVPTEALAAPQSPESEPIVYKRTAISTAKELTGENVRGKENDGRCELRVSYPGEFRIFTGRSWWHVLRVLFAQLESEKKPVAKPKEEPEDVRS